MFKYEEILPCDQLRPYIKCYYHSETITETVLVDHAYATGCIELMFNLGDGRWQTFTGNEFTTTPAVELWGQIIRPLTFRSLGNNKMLGIRFFPHTAFLFIDEVIERLNDRVTDPGQLEGSSIHMLHGRLLEADGLQQQVSLLDNFLLAKLAGAGKKLKNTALIHDVMNQLTREDFFDNISNVAARYGITSRYLQKLFLTHTGITPKLYSQIQRFQKSLVLVAQQNSSLTSIAYECGYFDQSHFIRSFRSFTGQTPSSFMPGEGTALLFST
ncbi:MAG: helix-turn-helix transcriptional regulator [Ferruginibacter sp.]